MGFKTLPTFILEKNISPKVREKNKYLSQFELEFIGQLLSIGIISWERQKGSILIVLNLNEMRFWNSF